MKYAFLTMMISMGSVFADAPNIDSSASIEKIPAGIVLTFKRPLEVPALSYSVFIDNLNEYNLSYENRDRAVRCFAELKEASPDARTISPSDSPQVSSSYRIATVPEYYSDFILTLPIDQAGPFKYIFCGYGRHSTIRDFIHAIGKNFDVALPESKEVRR